MIIEDQYRISTYCYFITLLNNSLCNSLLLQVNELNDTVENLQDEIGAMKTEIQRFQDDDVKFEEQRIAMIKEMEVNSCFHG